MTISKLIIFFDLETTGVNTSHDKIVQIGAIKLNIDGTEEVKNVLIDPIFKFKMKGTEIIIVFAAILAVNTWNYSRHSHAQAGPVIYNQAQAAEDYDIDQWIEQ